MAKKSQISQEESILVSLENSKIHQTLSCTTKILSKVVRYLMNQKRFYIELKSFINEIVGDCTHRIKHNGEKHILSEAKKNAGYQEEKGFIKTNFISFYCI